MSDESPMMKGPDKNYCKLFWRTIKNEAESTKQARVVHDRVLVVRVISPGAKNQEPEFELKRVFAAGGERINAAHYALYRDQVEFWEKNLLSTTAAGTPLESLPGVDAATIADLRAANVPTLEALRDVPDSRLAILGTGGRALREKARAIIEQAEGAAPMNRLIHENETLRADLESLKAQFADMQTMLDKETDPKRAGKRAAA